MEYREAIAEVAVISKEFYSACEEHRKCFRKKPFVGIRVQGAGDEDCNGLYERKDVSVQPEGWHQTVTRYVWKAHALPPYWYAGPHGRYPKIQQQKDEGDPLKKVLKMYFYIFFETWNFPKNLGI